MNLVFQIFLSVRGATVSSLEEWTLINGLGLFVRILMFMLVSSFAVVNEHGSAIRASLSDLDAIARCARVFWRTC